MSWWNSLTAAASKVQEVVTGEIELLLGEDDDDADDAGVAHQVEEHDFANDELAITPDIMEYVQTISSHPDTFLQFPIVRYKKRDSGFSLTKQQSDHAIKILEGVPQLNTLRRTLIPAHMSENDFWLVYFLLLSNVTSYEKRKTGNTPRASESPSPATKIPEPSDNQAGPVAESSLSQDEAETTFEAHFLRKLIASPAELLDEGIHPLDDSYFTPPDKARHAHKHVLSPGSNDEPWSPIVLSFNDEDGA